ncbi:DEAD/DEAH box helicase [Glaciimonas immobilis]|uniref:Superfamily II DNA or RNA helicase n=1 Tax=Glaciimonas immobilis TaxID=728004 RepID=A0A840RT35_9BURK|nr:DEAD/DEAH box helicase [Glaciimonas immobilis]KAF3999842.1 DEAD/DEAH box helicase [Glaciimonas immobilis]MBB5200322.1 superfamily II DNA or RNA helicase [Glaciimonas immobilis]
MLTIPFIFQDIATLVSDVTLVRAQEYVRQQRIMLLDDNGRNGLISRVRGNQAEIYDQKITLTDIDGSVDIEGICSCPVGYNCKHVVAAMLTYLQRADQIKTERADSQSVSGALPRVIGNWLHRVEEELVVKPMAISMQQGNATPDYRLVFALVPTQNGKQVMLYLCKARMRKDGRFSAIKPLGDSFNFYNAVREFLPESDHDAVSLFVALVSRKNQSTPFYQSQIQQNNCELNGKLGAQLLRLLLEQKNLVWANTSADLSKGQAHFVALSGARNAILQWREQHQEESLEEPREAPTKWARPNGQALKPVRDTPREVSKLVWQFAPAHEGSNGLSEPEAVSANGQTIDYVLPTTPPWYIDNLSCGELTLPPLFHQIAQTDLINLVTQAPLLDAENKKQVAQLLLSHGVSDVIPLPVAIPFTVLDNITPQPILVLDSVPDGHGGMQDFAQLLFSYDGAITSAEFVPVFQRNSDRGVEKIVRHQGVERAASQTLQDLRLQVMHNSDQLLCTRMRATRTATFVMDNDAAWLHFAKNGLPALTAAGWQIDKSPDYRFDVVEIEDWYADITEADRQQDDATQAGEKKHGALTGTNGAAAADFDGTQDSVQNGSQPSNPWFDLALGIVVNQERVSLLPLLIDLIRQAPDNFSARALAQHPDDDAFLIQLESGVRVALPWGRIKPILNTLGELYFTDKVGDSVRLSVLDAARLAELEGSAELRWMGGTRLRELGEKLNSFGGVQQVAVPEGLQATLRDYQRDGLSWMQFLREYDFAGILADDMGLGKTIQTLAHILIEKNAGRLTSPALVVAPTSLMSNWQEEAARFAPGLKVLILQGKQRLALFDQINAFDVVLTTYALLPRDEERLRAYQYHLLILDEAHYIKNARSKAAQSVSLLDARHRLCLTGTPVENHLGELWSQFHFLLPGLLGSEKEFNRDFRTPIEKYADDSRRTLLVRRIKPFLLRRTKDAVASELPPKTEMVRHVELSGAQRDLYETVRLAMDKKVRAAIESKGVAGSHIIILEALLKLRQACCDPRLVKVAGDTARTAHVPSAKLLELMEMVDELRQEDRRILIFSQFTSMLALIAEALTAANITYALLTGDTKDRGAVVRSFQNGEVPVFLISLKAGGVGLNLTTADTVIHYDPWWNPAAELQATDRAWRIGQDKPVFVYKLIAKGTVEEKIQALQGKKAALAEAILGTTGAAMNLKLTAEDLQAIFEPLD